MVAAGHDRPTQAAEIFLRRRLGEQMPGRDSLAGDGAGVRGGLGSALSVRAAGDEVVRIRLEDTGMERPSSCGGEPEAMTQVRGDVNGSDSARVRRQSQCSAPASHPATLPS